MKVGARHGRPAVLVIDAAGMYWDGATFLRTENEVWLTDHVPPDCLEVLTRTGLSEDGWRSR